MFGFMQDAGTYQSRKVDRWDNEDKTKMISTAAVSDGRKPFETAVLHPSYNEGKMVIVECYDTKAKAQKGHNNWLDLMLNNKLPKVLTDCGNSIVSQMADIVGCDMDFEEAS